MIFTLPRKIAAAVLVLCGTYFLFLALYLVLSPLLPISFGTVLGMSDDFFPIAQTLGSRSYGIGLIVIALPVAALGGGFLLDAWLLYKSSRTARYIAIAFFLLPLLGLFFNPQTFFAMRSVSDVLFFLLRLLFLALGVSLLVIELHGWKNKK